mgnify:CR=1 FL=1
MEDRSARSFRSRDSRDRRMDHWLETGRQLVDGVSGRRPGQRRSGLDLDSVGRWVGDRIEWLLEDDEDWREPWQESQATDVLNRRGKRPLEAISRRDSQRPSSTASAPVRSSQPASSQQAPINDAQTPLSASEGDAEGDAWPDDESFRVEHWTRSSDQPPKRALPRSSRRRT